MKYILILLFSFSLSLNAQNVKKVKLFVNHISDHQKANALSIDLEHSIIYNNGP